MSGILYNLLVILNLLSPESQLWSKNDASVKNTLPPRFWSVGIVFVTFVGLLAVASKIKSKILHPEKEYFFSVFPGLMIVSKRMIRHEDDIKLVQLKSGCKVLSHKSLRRMEKILTHKKQRITR